LKNQDKPDSLPDARLLVLDRSRNGAVAVIHETGRAVAK